MDFCMNEQQFAAFEYGNGGDQKSLSMHRYDTEHGTSYISKTPEGCILSMIFVVRNLGRYYVGIHEEGDFLRRRAEASMRSH